jgi:glycosyltransferase involved in cell wall biosynthesis
MRVLHVMTAFPRDETDVIAPWLVEMLARMRERGIDVEVLTSSYKGLGDQVTRGIPVHRFRYFPSRWENLTHEETAPDRMRRSLLYRIMPAFYVAAGMMSAWRLARRNRYDIVHVHWPMPHALFGWAAQRASGARVVATFYSVEVRWISRAMPALKAFLRWTIRFPDRVVAISRATAEEIQSVVRVPVDVIPYTVALPPSPATNPADGRFRILFVGRLVERKGVDVLLRALAQLRDLPQVEAVIVGDGPERQRLEALSRELGIDGQVKFTGRVPDDELRRQYAAASAFVLPAIVDVRGDTEGLGVVLLEAMNSRIPVIASNAGGIVDIVEHERSGLLVPAGDAAALASAMRRLATDRTFARSLGEAGHRRLNEHFTWDSIVSRWTSIYTNVLASRRPPAA